MLNTIERGTSIHRSWTCRKKCVKWTDEDTCLILSMASGIILLSDFNAGKRVILRWRLWSLLWKAQGFSSPSLTGHMVCWTEGPSTWQGMRVLFCCPRTPGLHALQGLIMLPSVREQYMPQISNSICYGYSLPSFIRITKRCQKLKPNKASEATPTHMPHTCFLTLKLGPQQKFLKRITSISHL